MLFNVFDSITQEVETLFAQDYENNTQLAIAIKSYIRSNNEDLVQYLIKTPSDIELVVKYKVFSIDCVLQNIWLHFFKDNKDLCLGAVGGYGRRELMPHSDIDLVILLEDGTQEANAEQLSTFVTFLWDTGLDIGSSVRTIEDCKTEAIKDLTVITNLMEGFYLAGKETLFTQMIDVISVKNMWSKKDFFKAKLKERDARYQRFNDASYKLEPNLKESPGGLRDIHHILWVLKRAFNVNELHEIQNIGFIQPDECEALIEGRNFLWLIRFLLHGFAKRQENRVLFNHQQTLADVLGYTGERLNDRIEQVMQRYFRTITELSRLNELLLQLFREEILFKNKKQVITRINNRFQIRNGYLETQSEELFKLFPPALLETFVILSTHEEIIGVRAETIRQIRNNLDEINEEFRSDSICKTLFIQIFRYPNGLTHQLRRMARYGILSRYIPAFENVVGRMQYDLFHVYSVDQHTLMVVRNLRRFAIKEHAHEFPDCSAIIKKLPNNEVLFLAALFHDIAKGRNGNHAKLGAIEAKNFAIQHEMSSADTKLLTWLVASHLDMSLTAQRKDLTDPETIYEFAKKVGTINYLRQLYLLTICDMRATNPEAWSDWKYQLLSDLYNKALTVLKRGLDNPIDIDKTIFKKKQHCIKKLTQGDFSYNQVNEIWDTFRKSYFIHIPPTCQIFE
jgi:[protein-PII] uridylyltransferase